MSTRALIGKTTEAGNVIYIYLHSDGYPERAGKILMRHYASARRVVSLLSYGNCSILDAKIGKKHPFDYSERPADTCTFYGRDRGERGNDAVTVAMVDYRQAADDWDADYVYMYHDGEWLCCEPGKAWQPVADLIPAEVLA